MDNEEVTANVEVSPEENYRGSRDTLNDPISYAARAGSREGLDGYPCYTTTLRGSCDALDGPPPGLISFTPASTPQVKWQFGDKEFDRDLIQFITVYLLIAIIAITSLVNLSLGTDRTELWASLLSIMCGVIIPQPQYKKSRKLVDPNGLPMPRSRENLLQNNQR